jgi:GntR family transcriptional regulator / MocR family aminotransferase
MATLAPRGARDAHQRRSGLRRPRGVQALRTGLADYLGRVRGVAADPACVVVTSGYSQGQGIICRVLAARGARRIAFENPSHAEQRRIAARAGLQIVPVAVDEAGIRVEEPERAEVDAVVLTPAHQHPTGAVLSGDRRTALLAWLRARDVIAIEDDYDAEYRYDRAAVGVLQGRQPDRIVYAGSASKTLAPALRLGWLVVPPSLLDAVADEKDLADCGTARIEQHAFANFLARGELDRHLRRMRTRYRRRRDLLVQAIASELPEATVCGIAAGLHATVQLPADHNEQAILDQAQRRRIDLAPWASSGSNQAADHQRSCSATRRSPSTPSSPASASSPERSEQPARQPHRSQAHHPIWTGTGGLQRVNRAGRRHSGRMGRRLAWQSNTNSIVAPTGFEPALPP